MEVITAYLASKIDRYRMTGMRVYYDPKHDVMYMEFSDRSVVDTVEVKEGILIDYGENDEIVGIEKIDAS